jgi:predicted transcriptional regulator
MYSMYTFDAEVSMRQAVITARVDGETADKIGHIASCTGRSRSWLVAKALKEFADREAAFIAFVQEGIDAVDRGETVDEAEADRRIDSMLRDLPE